ncbi:MAG: arsenate reductase (glutaredoxin) [Psychroflexus halocasei]|uniref:arsenate reductase (glutaredoxin) n=1 Tax=Psychroflexus sp. S27 TaxID=1982757 RepID=UPI000C2B2100|nr:arsenate reductase (glutaredoxin) [Psychroflexus sp. S27]PJX24656.1 arsenate reductase (glutaredoxin) [Psychroflexus sp. S27]
MIKIYHNPRCSKSRQGLEILKESGQEHEVIQYLKEPLSIDELKKILKLLNIKPIALVRKNEKIWKENYKEKVDKLSDNDIIQAMIENPKLIERPIVVNGEKAVIGRPPEDIKEIL